MKIVETKYYSAMEAQKFMKINSRQYIAKYINEGFLLAIQTGDGPHKRYSILGAWLLDFKKRYKAGLKKKFTAEQIDDAIQILKNLKNNREII